MRLKKESGSYSASGLKIRNARHDKSFDGACSAPSKKLSRKQKRIQCGKKEGRKHRLVWRQVHWHHRDVWTVTCEKCNKQIEHDWSGELGPNTKRGDAFLEEVRAKYEAELGA